VDGETVDAPAGTIVFIAEPTLVRVAIAEEEGTVVLAVGGEPGRAYAVSPWEFYFAARPLLHEGRFDDAIMLLEEGMEEHPGNASILYNLACAEAQAGRPQAAVGHLSESIRRNPDYARHARTDPDLESIRDEPGFPAEA
jgi:tetratricopeptide (TPR) repeat protein